MIHLPFCPRCGTEVSHEKESCQKCGTSIKYEIVEGPPDRLDFNGHLNLGFDIVRKNPIIFLPSIISTLITSGGFWIIIMWAESKGIIAELYRELGISPEIIPVTYFSLNQSTDLYTFFGYLFLFGLLASVFDLIATGASLDLSNDALRGKVLNVKKSLRFGATNFFRLLFGMIVLVLVLFVVMIGPIKVMFSIARAIKPGSVLPVPVDPVLHQDDEMIIEIFNLGCQTF